LIYPTESLSGRGGAPERLAHAHPQAGTDETDGPPDAGRPSVNEAGPGEEAKPKRKKRRGGDYFAVCAYRFAEALGLGVPYALAYLVLARFTDEDQRTTDAGAAAIARQLRMKLKHASQIRDRLETNNLISVPGQSGQKYRRLLSEAVAGNDGLIWLPNRLIGDKKGEVSRLWDMRHLKDAVPVLTTLLHVYHANHLLRHDGVDPKAISRRAKVKFEGQENGRTKLFSMCPYHAWRYDLAAAASSPLSRFLPQNDAHASQTLDLLIERRLIRIVPYLFSDSPENDGEAIEPLALGEGEPPENSYGTAHNAAVRYNYPTTRKFKTGILRWIAFDRDFQDATLCVVGIVRPSLLTNTERHQRWLIYLEKQWARPADCEAQWINNPRPSKAGMRENRPFKGKADIPMEFLNEMAAQWNDMAREHGLPQVSEVTAKRAAMLRTRIHERWRSDPMAGWRDHLEAIAASPFLLGENERVWRVDFDWAIRPCNVVKVAEGTYSREVV
jgi:hypothetical protein